MENIFKYIGIGLLIVGVLGGIIGYSSIDHKSYKDAKEIFDELSDNEYAEAEYITAKTIWISEVSVVISSALGAIIGGLVLLGFGRMIELQTKMSQTLLEIKASSKNIA